MAFGILLYIAIGVGVRGSVLPWFLILRLVGDLGPNRQLSSRRGLQAPTGMIEMPRASWPRMSVLSNKEYLSKLS